MKHFSTCYFLLCALYLQAQTGTFTEQHTLKCGDSMTIGGLGYPTWNDPKIIQSATYGQSVLIGDFVAANILVYTAPPFFQGTDTVIIECAHATQITCDTGIYVFNVVCDSFAQDVILHHVPCNDTLYTDDLSGWWAPQINLPPQHGQATMIYEPTDGAGILYIPNPGFEGNDWTVVVFGNNIFPPTLYIFTVDCKLSGTKETNAPVRLSLSPNPATDFVHFQTDEPIQNIQLFDALGRAIHAPVERTDTGQYTLDIRHLPTGLYFVHGTVGQKRVSGRFLVGVH